MENSHQEQDSPSTRIIRRGAEVLTRNRRRILYLVAFTAVLVWFGSGVYTVDKDEAAAVLRFGRLVDDAVPPGLHFALPPGIDHVSTVRTEEVHREEVLGDLSMPVSLLTGDENVIEITLVVQYQTTGVGEYLYRTEAPEMLLNAAVRSSLVDVVARMPVDLVLTAGKARIENEVRARAQQMLQAYHSGISIASVNLQSVNPPIEAADAFRRVSDSRAEAAQLINEAESERSRTASLARGEAERAVEASKAAATARVEGAKGAALRFEQVLAQKKRMPEQTRLDLYMAMVTNVLPRTRIVVLAPDQAPRIEVNLAPAEDEQEREAEAPPSDPESIFDLEQGG